MRDESDTVREKLERLHQQGAFPKSPIIRRFDVYADNDSTGDPAYYIAVLLDDATPEEELTPDTLRAIDRIVFDAVFKGPEERWPYIRVVREQDYFAAVEEW